MCIIAFAQNVHPDYPLILIGNRDEFFLRPTRQVHWWDEEILAGKDLKAGGTWLGISKAGRFATVTNYRDIKGIKNNARSRGEIPLNFLNGKTNQEEYHKELRAKYCSKYNYYTESDCEVNE